MQSQRHIPHSAAGFSQLDLNLILYYGHVRKKSSTFSKGQTKVLSAAAAHNVQYYKFSSLFLFSGSPYW